MNFVFSLSLPDFQQCTVIPHVTEPLTMNRYKRKKTSLVPLDSHPHPSRKCNFRGGRGNPQRPEGVGWRPLARAPRESDPEPGMGRDRGTPIPALCFLSSSRSRGDKRKGCGSGKQAMGRQTPLTPPKRGAERAIYFRYPFQLKTQPVSSHGPSYLPPSWPLLSSPSGVRLGGTRS